MKKHLIALLLAMRLPFLLLTCSVVLLAIASAIATGHDINASHAVLLITGALTAHISVNLLNEYQDFHSGLDAVTTKTPFSGGSGALITTPLATKLIAKMTILFLITTIAIGLYFTLTVGLPILAIGLVGVSIITLYTQWINKKAILCLTACGFSFGPLIVLGSYFVLAGEINWGIFLISLLPFFLTNNLLLINQFPDIEPDKSVGRNNFPIKYGIKLSLYVYLIFSLFALINTMAIVHYYHLSVLSYIALAPIFLSLIKVAVLMKQKKVMTNIVSAMLFSVISAIITPLILALAIVVN